MKVLVVVERMLIISIVLFPLLAKFGLLSGADILHPDIVYLVYFLFTLATFVLYVRRSWMKATLYAFIVFGYCVCLEIVLMLVFFFFFFEMPPQ